MNNLFPKKWIEEIIKDAEDSFKTLRGAENPNELPDED